MNFKISLLALSLFASASQAAEKCNFNIDPTTLHVNWTAFKTMQKVGVNGSFTEVTLESDLSKPGTLHNLMNQIDAEIKVDAATKISTTNPARDQTIFQNFFSHFAGKGILKGKLRNAKGSESAGTVNLVLEMNKKTLAVPMKYTRDEKGTTVISGGIDVTDFGLGSALSTLNKACDALHKGPDGVSKTWPQVEIKIEANLSKKCS